MQKKCKICLKSFNTHLGGQKTCSDKCSMELKKKRAIKSTQYHKSKYNKRKEKFGKCHGKIELVCKTCGNKYSVYSSQALHRGSSFCSLYCRNKGMKTKTPLKKTIDALWAKIIKERAGRVCEFDGCNKSKYLNAHHIFSRTNHSTRWDLDNGIALCPSHHTLGNVSAHKSPMEFSEWLRENRGESWYFRLKNKAKTPKKQDYGEVKLFLEEQLESLTNQHKQLLKKKKKSL